jgi:hypothetical protein
MGAEALVAEGEAIPAAVAGASVEDSSTDGTVAPSEAVPATKPKRASRTTKSTAATSVDAAPVEAAVGSEAPTETAVATKPKRASRARKADAGEVAS